MQKVHRIVVGQHTCLRNEKPLEYRQRLACLAIEEEDMRQIELDAAVPGIQFLGDEQQDERASGIAVAAIHAGEAVDHLDLLAWTGLTLRQVHRSVPAA